MRKLRKSIIACCVAVGFAFAAAVSLCVRALYTPRTAAAVDGGIKIVLDAGHGGIDGGVTGQRTGVKESDVNLQITFALKKALEENGFSVILTRKTKEGLYDTTARGFKKRDMQKRKEIIERESPALILSLHQNFYASQSQRGGQVFYGNYHPKSRVLATLLQTALNGLYAKENVKARKEHYGEYFMLQCYYAPSVIVECGFLSNPQDEELLIDERWQKEFADTIAKGVVTYFIEQTA